MLRCRDGNSESWDNPVFYQKKGSRTYATFSYVKVFFIKRGADSTLVLFDAIMCDIVVLDWIIL